VVLLKRHAVPQAEEMREESAVEADLAVFQQRQEGALQLFKDALIKMRLVCTSRAHRTVSRALRVWNPAVFPAPICQYALCIITQGCCSPL
jgi:hypothetical protein